MLLIAFIFGCFSYEPSCKSMEKKIKILHNSLHNSSVQIERIANARKMNQIGRKKYIIVYNSIMDLEINIINDINATYEKMNYHGCNHKRD